MTEAELQAENDALRKQVAELSQVYLTKAGPRPDGTGFQTDLKSTLVPIIASAMAEMFIDMGAKNYLEVEVDTSPTHPEVGRLLVNFQRKFGKTPGQLKSEADARMAAMIEVVRDCCQSIRLVTYDVSGCDKRLLEVVANSLEQAVRDATP